MDATDIVNLLELGICAAVGYAPLVAATGYIVQSSIMQQKVQSQEHLEDIICEEAILLGIGDQLFRATFPAEFNGFKYEVSQDVGHYHICIQDSRMGTRAIVRNQLYSISKGTDGRAKTVKEGLRHLFVTKPRAILYGAFRINV